MADILTPDLCVVGGTPAGLAAAAAARQLGASVVLVEAGPIGVAGPDSTLPAAVLRHVARDARHRAVDGPLPASTAGPDWSRLAAAIRQAVAAAAPQDAARRLEALGLTVVGRPGRFIDPRTMEAGDQQIRARRYLLTPAHAPVLPAIEGLDSVPFLLPAGIGALPARPDRLAVIGDTAEAIALAQGFGRLGTAVTLLSPGAVPLPRFDPELVDLVLRRLREEGVVVRLGVIPAGAEPIAAGVQLRLGSGPEEERLSVTHLLIAAGSVPQLDGLGLDKARLKPDAADPTGYRRRGPRTSNRRIFIPTADSDGQFDHAAIAAARDAVDRALLGGGSGQLPSTRIVASDPALAEVGEREVDAAARLKANVRVLRAAVAENDRARAEGTTAGVVKVVTDPAGVLLGGGIVGADAAELAALFDLAIGAGLSLRKFATLAPPHPSYAEIATVLAAEFERDGKPDAGRARRFRLNRWRR